MFAIKCTTRTWNNVIEGLVHDFSQISSQKLKIFIEEKMLVTLIVTPVQRTQSGILYIYRVSQKYGITSVIIKFTIK